MNQRPETLHHFDRSQMEHQLDENVHGVERTLDRKHHWPTMLQQCEQPSVGEEMKWRLHDDREQLATCDYVSMSLVQPSSTDQLITDYQTMVTAL